MKHTIYIQAFGKKYRSEIEANSLEEAESIALTSAQNQIKIAPQVEFKAISPELENMEAALKIMQLAKEMSEDINVPERSTESDYINRLKDLARKRGMGESVIKLIDDMNKE